MSEVVPLPSFGEVFFDARGQERCLRVTWHEGTLVLSLWRGEMCTASFRMPLDDVGRLLDTLDEGYAEATGETQPDEPAAGTEVIPGTGTYHRPAPRPQQPEERQPAPLGPNDVLVARGNPNHQDKLVASHGETTPSRGTPQHQQPFTGPQYAPEQGGEPFTGPQYAPDPGYRDPYSGPQYVQQEPFSGPQYSGDSGGQPVYQMPGNQAPHTDPLGFPSQSRPAAEPSYDYGNQYQQQSAPQPTAAGGAGLGTPMHGIPGAGRRRDPFHGQEPNYSQEPTYSSQDQVYRQDQQYGQDRYGGGNPVDPLMSMGQQQEPDRTRPYLGEPLFSTGERLRPDQDYDDRRDRREW